MFGVHGACVEPVVSDACDDFRPSRLHGGHGGLAVVDDRDVVAVESQQHAERFGGIDVVVRDQDLATREVSQRVDGGEGHRSLPTSWTRSTRRLE